MKLYLYVEEAYPVYDLSDTKSVGTKEVEVDQDLWERYRKAARAWHHIQEELDQAFGGHA